MTDQAAGQVANEERAEAALAVVPMEDRNLRGLQLAREIFPDEDRRAIATLLSVPADSPALLPYLALCIGQGFSPWANHVWLIPKKIKIKGADGEQDRTEEKHIPAVGRDGLLHKARQSKGQTNGYKGMQFGVVCEHDSFEVEYTGDIEKDPKVLHRFASKPTQFEPGVAPDRYRGKVIGAWAKCYVDGEPPTFYFANLREHGRLRQSWAFSPADRKRRPLYLDPKGEKTFAEFTAGIPNNPVLEWEGAWDYTSTMVLKSAQSYVLRIALGVTGIVPVDELRDVAAWQADTGPAQGTEAIIDVTDHEFDFDTLPESLRDRMREAIAAANNMEPFSWGPAKCEMVLSNRVEAELLAIVEQIEEENAIRERRLASMEPQAEEEVVDGEVVGTPAEEGDVDVDAPPAPEAAEKIDELKHRLADLEAARAEVEPGSEEHASLSAEMDQVEAAMRELGA